MTGELAWAPVVLFGVIFFWTPPHFWALAIRYREDYSAADVPMLPSVADDATVGRQIVAYTVVVWALSLLFVPVADMGLLYTVAAVVLGAVFTGQSLRLKADPTPRRPWPSSTVHHLREPPVRRDGGGFAHRPVIPLLEDPLCKVPNRP